MSSGEDSGSMGQLTHFSGKIDEKNDTEMGNSEKPCLFELRSLMGKRSRGGGTMGVSLTKINASKVENSAEPPRISTGDQLELEVLLDAQQIFHEFGLPCCLPRDRFACAHMIFGAFQNATRGYPKIHG